MTNQRMIAALLAIPLVLALIVVAWIKPLPYTTYGPGPTLDVLGTNDDGDEIVQITGEQTYRDAGELRMTTVSVSPPGTQQGLWQLVGTWLDGSDAVYPYDSVYPEDVTPEESKAEGQVEMSSSQQSAEIAALTDLGYDIEPAGLEVSSIVPGSPADGALALGDRFVQVGGTTIEEPQQVVDAIEAADGGPVEFVVQRDGARETVSVTPEQVDGSARVGVGIGPAYDFPFGISVNVDPRIGGPSAGLMFALAIYDTLTPGSLTGEGTVAGTGTIDSDGVVGAIGGIQQKVVGARESGAGMFLVPSGNCADVQGADAGDMRLVRATTLNDARTSIQAWVEDPDAELPACGDDDGDDAVASR